MIFTEQLLRAQQLNDSLLCVGLDPEPAKFPTAWKGHPEFIYDFCAAIVDATKDQVCAFKPQIAYFAAHRAEDQLERLMAHIRRVAPQVPVILDAKRGDIGSTAEQYAVEAFTRYGADAVTVNPYMGSDTLEPFLRHRERGVVADGRFAREAFDDVTRVNNVLPVHEGKFLRHLAGADFGFNDCGERGHIAGLLCGDVFPE